MEYSVPALRRGRDLGDLHQEMVADLGLEEGVGPGDDPQLDFVLVVVDAIRLLRIQPPQFEASLESLRVLPL